MHKQGYENRLQNRIGIDRSNDAGNGLAASAATAAHGSRFFILTLGLLFLVQSLARDLWLLSRKREASKPRRTVRCMCLETGVGIIPIIISAIMMFGGLSRPITIPYWVWIIGVPATMLTCFWLKDYVFEWNPWRIRRDDDHINIVFTGRR